MGGWKKTVERKRLRMTERTGERLKRKRKGGERRRRRRR